MALTKDQLDEAIQTLSTDPTARKTMREHIAKLDAAQAATDKPNADVKPDKYPWVKMPGSVRQPIFGRPVETVSERKAG